MRTQTYAYLKTNRAPEKKDLTNGNMAMAECVFHLKLHNVWIFVRHVFGIKLY